MSNPRKFSEKIALHAQKQAEGTAAFEAILREVSETTKPVSSCSSMMRLQQPVSKSFQLGRSLPNVNQMTAKNSIDLQSALSSLADMKQAMVRGGGQLLSTEQLNRDRRSQSQPRKLLPLNTHRDGSPYRSAYLTAPSEASWRRASSDSAIHAHVITGDRNQSDFGGSGTILTSSTDETGQLRVRDAGMDCFWEQRSVQDQLKARSCEVPRIDISVPITNDQLYSSGGGGGERPNRRDSVLLSGAGSTVRGVSACNIDVHRVKASSSSSSDGTTGSLPDLATINFVTPLFPPPLELITGLGGGGVKSRGGGGIKGGGGGGGGPVLPTRVHRQCLPAPLVLNSSNYRLPSNTLSPDVGVISHSRSAGSSGGTVFNLSPISPSSSLHSPFSAISTSPTLYVSPADSPSVVALNHIEVGGGSSGGGAQQQLLLMKLQQKLMQQYHHQQLQRQISPLSISSQTSPLAVSRQQQTSPLVLSSPPQMSPHATLPTTTQKRRATYSSSSQQQQPMSKSDQQHPMSPNHIQRSSHLQNNVVVQDSRPRVSVRTGHRAQRENNEQESSMVVTTAGQENHRIDDGQRDALLSRILQFQHRQQSKQPAPSQINYGQQMPNLPAAHQSPLNIQQQQHQQQHVMQQQTNTGDQYTFRTSMSELLAQSAVEEFNLQSPTSSSSSSRTQHDIQRQFSNVPHAPQLSSFQSHNSSLPPPPTVPPTEMSVDAESEQLLVDLIAAGFFTAAQLDEWGISAEDIYGASYGKPELLNRVLSTNGGDNFDHRNLSSSAFQFSFSPDTAATVQSRSTMSSSSSMNDNTAVARGDVKCCPAPRVTSAQGYFSSPTALPLCNAVVDVIPDIVLTAGCTSPVDPPSTSSDPLNTRAYLGDSFEDFSTEDALRLGLDPLASEELEMLDDPSVITDQATEDMFRLDQGYWKTC